MIISVNNRVLPATNEKDLYGRAHWEIPCTHNWSTPFHYDYVIQKVTKKF
jgi:hypothetical protein